MNSAQFKKLLESITMEQWQAVVNGEALVLVDDEQLQLGPTSHNEAIIVANADNAQSADELRQTQLEEVDDTLVAFYLTRPLTRNGFTNQVRALVDKHGAEMFGAPEGEQAELTLFVDVAEVVVEDANSPRHRYGASCEFTSSMLMSAQEQVMRWVESGEAYDRYLGMNVCRYNC